MRSNIWRGNISFGLINIGVTLQSAQQDRDIYFSMLDEKDNSPIKYKKMNAKTGKEVPYERIVKGYEYEKNNYVIMDAKDFKAANPKASQTLDIEDFVHVEDVDPMLYEKPYYIVPQKGAEKSYLLLRDVLKKTKTVAIGKMVMHTKQHLSMIMPRGDYLVLENLRFAHEIKEESEVNYLDDIDMKKKYSAKEFEMAQALVKGMTAEWEPEKFKDTYYDDIMKIINKKVKEGDNYVIEKDGGEKTEKSSNVVDLLPLLRKSLAGKSKAGSHSSDDDDEDTDDSHEGPSSTRTKRSSTKSSAHPSKKATKKSSSKTTSRASAKKPARKAAAGSRR